MKLGAARAHPNLPATRHPPPATRYSLLASPNLITWRPQDPTSLRPLSTRFESLLLENVTKESRPLPPPPNAFLRYFICLNFPPPCNSNLCMVRNTIKILKCVVSSWNCLYYLSLLFKCSLIKLLLIYEREYYYN